MSALTGGRVNYYLAQVDHPQREEQPAYQAECEDIIQALQMDFNEACEFKAIWRTASARLGNGKSGQKAKYDAEKRIHYAKRSLKHIENLELGDVKREPGKKDLATAIEWTVWRGENCISPVASDQRVEFVLRNNKTGRDLAKNLHWGHDSNDADIVMYRLLG